METLTIDENDGGQIINFLEGFLYYNTIKVYEISFI